MRIWQIVCVTLGLAAVTLSAGLRLTRALASDTWPMFQRTAAHTGAIKLPVKPSLFTLRWQKDLGRRALNPVTAAAGMVFVSEQTYFDGDAGLSVFRSSDGKRLWRTTFGDVYSVNPPSYADGNVYIQTGNHSDDTYLRAYKAATGELVFRAPHSAQWESYYAPTILDGRVYVNGGGYGGMYAFDAVNGAQYWSLDLPQYDQWTPAVDSTWAYAYLGEYEPGLYVVDRLTGQLVRRIPDPRFEWSGWSMDLAPVLAGAGRVLAIQDGRLLCFDTSKGRIHWEVRGAFMGQPVVAKDIIYAISASSLSARKLTTGDQLWAWEAPGENLRGTMIATSSHIFARSDTSVYAVNIRTHRAEWRYAKTGELSLAEGVLYIASTDGMLTAIDLGVADLSVMDPPVIQFSDVNVGASTSRTFRIANRGGSALAVTGIDIEAGTPFSVSAASLPWSIPPLKSSSPVTVTFSPTSSGEYAGRLTIASNDPNEPRTQITLVGTGN